MRKHIALGVALMLGASGTALADGVSYNYLEGIYGYTDVKGVGGHEDSFTVGGSYGFGESFFGFGDISTWDGGAGNKGTHGSLGLGWHTGLTDTVDFLAGVSFNLIDPKGGSSETGYGANIGLRGRMGMNVELNGGVNYYDFGQGLDGFDFGVGGRYYFNDAFSTGLGFAMDDEGDAKTISVVLRYDFGG